jgi:chaperonin cofactor prefoldin
MKKIVTLSAVAFLSTSVFASSSMEAKLSILMEKIEQMEKRELAQQKRIDALTSKIENLQGSDTALPSSDFEKLEKRVAKTEKMQKRLTKKVSKVNSLAANDNLKFDVDFRTSYDNLTYKTAGGTKYKNDGLYASRLHLGMGYAPIDDLVFKGQLSFNKSFGASYGQRATGMGFDTFDWIVNEQLTDDTLRVREAYWLWTPTLGDRGYTFSVGRRPSTNGFLVNLRDDDKAKSPMGHIINMEFDGASASMKLDDVSPGMYAKLCLGRGLTNAASWASGATYYSGGIGGEAIPNYVKSENALDNVDMLGVILKPYDDGQYSVMTKYYRGFNVPGMVGNPTFNPANPINSSNPAMLMKSLGDMDGAAISVKIDGIGEEINDFLDETTVFASYAWSKTRPDADGAMLGSLDEKTGTSYWIGAQMPNLTGGKFGLEYNHGSKYWRSFTYGEDTMIGSKLAARGDAYEAYWTQPLLGDVLSMQIRYTYINYDYTGSNAFFGDAGTPMSMSEAQAAGMDPVEKAQDLRVHFRYRY